MTTTHGGQDRRTGQVGPRTEDRFLSELSSAFRPREDNLSGPVLSRIFLSEDRRVSAVLRRADKDNAAVLSGDKRTAGRRFYLRGQHRRTGQRTADLSYRLSVFTAVVLTSVLWMGVGVALAVL